MRHASLAQPAASFPLLSLNARQPAQPLRAKEFSQLAAASRCAARAPLLCSPASAGRSPGTSQRSSTPSPSGGRPWLKIRTRLTAEAVVGGVIGPLDHPEALVLGRPDQQGRLRVAGRTRPLSPAVRAELAALLTPAAAGHPWPLAIPSSWFGQLPSKPIDYRPVVPDRVVELDVDTAFERHRWRHGARFVRVRPDLQPADLLTTAPGAGGSR